MNPYSVLNLPTSSTYEEIKSRYKTLAQLHHPDKGGDEEFFKDIKLAYEILIDPARRMLFDATGQIHTVELKTEAMDIMSRMIINIAQNFQVGRDNLLFMLEREINQLITIATNDTEVAKTHIVTLEGIIEKIRIKTNGENLIIGILTTQLNIRLNDIKLFARRIEICKLMLDILRDYEYGLIGLAFVNS